MCSGQAGRECCQFSFDLDEGVLIIMKRLVLAILVVLSLAAASKAQTFRGTILGTVTDASGAAVAGASVTVKNQDTGILRSTQTTPDGEYRVPELAIGTYMVTVEMSGFQTAITRDVKVDVATHVLADRTRETGQL